jgi:hypothetical protein
MVKKNETNRAGMGETSCYVCKAAPGELHEMGCQVELCPYCGHQLISCCCGEGSDVIPDADRMPWTGEWPGFAECREFGWYCLPCAYAFVRCGPDAPEAMPNLNRLHTEAVWDKKAKRFVLPTMRRPRKKR